MHLKLIVTKRWTNYSEGSRKGRQRETNKWTITSWLIFSNTYTYFSNTILPFFTTPFETKALKIVNRKGLVPISLEELNYV